MAKKILRLPIYDFSRGMYTRSPKEKIPLNATPYCKNVLWDEKNRLSKVFGTTELLAAANNAFATNPIYNLYNYITKQGAEKLIIQAVSTTMKIWFMDTDDTAVTEITPTGITLAMNRRMNFATHKGLLYAWNGVNDLMCWQAQTSATWSRYHVDEKERFNYLATHNYRLWAANSIRNPIRLIYTGVNEEHFGAYYGDCGINPATNEAYVGSENFIDFPTQDGTPVTGICEFQDSLLVFKPYHIYRVFGDALYGITKRCVCTGVGCVAHDSITVHRDGRVYFLGHDGVYSYGDSSMIVSAEDQKAQAAPNVIRLTSEIDNYWATNFTAPNPLAVRTIVKTADVVSGSWTLTSCLNRTAPISTHRPDVVTFTLTDGNDEETIVHTSAASAYVNLQSVDATNGYYDGNIYYAETFTPGRMQTGSTRSYGIANEVDLYVTNNGTLTSTQKLNVFITDTKTDDIGVVVPDMSVIYAEGQYSDCSGITEPGWITVVMSYWDYPQALGTIGDPTYKMAIVVKPVGDTTALYVKWGYAAEGTYSGGQMINSDKYTPGSQYLCDYCFRLNCENFTPVARIITDAFNASADDDFVNWISVELEEDTKTARNYTKRTKLTALEYSTSANGSDWDDYVETENGGDISAAKKYVKFRLTYRRKSGASADDGDSFALIAVRANYNTQAITQKLVKGVMWDDRYLLCGNLADSGG
jgi:hypothetical protein